MKFFFFSDCPSESNGYIPLAEYHNTAIATTKFKETPRLCIC